MLADELFLGSLDWTGIPSAFHVAAVEPELVEGEEMSFRDLLMTDPPAEFTEMWNTDIDRFFRHSETWSPESGAIFHCERTTNK